MIDFAPAKLNLNLFIGGKRPDGYHELNTLFQEIDICDRLQWDPDNHSPLNIDMGPAWKDFPLYENLCYKVASCFSQATGHKVGGQLSIKKMIPAGAGLGGGSSDAMTFLKMLNRYFEKPLDGQECQKIGNKFGSDLAFFYRGGRQRGRGRGEVLESLPFCEGKGHLFLLPVALSTAKVYGLVLPEDLLVEGPTANHLLPAARRCSSKFAELFDQLKSVWPNLCMSGSGSSCFVLTDEQINPKQKSILTDLSIKSVSFRFAKSSDL